MLKTDIYNSFEISLCTNAYYKQLLQERKNDTFTSKDEINMLKKVVEALTKEISILEQEIKK